MVKHKNVFDQKSNSYRPEVFASGKLQDLQTCFRAAGLPHTVTVSPILAARCGWTDSAVREIDRHQIAWLVGLALTGQWPHRQRETNHGQVLLVEFPIPNGADQAITIPFGVVVGEDQKIHLVAPDELDQPAPKRACVLAAEDDLELARLISTLLERGGFAVTLAANGIDAWSLVQNQHFDLVVLDINMPGLTGIEVCRNIKATPRLAHLPVILCSGRLDLSEAAQEAGANDFVEKPAGLSHLVERIEKLLGSNGLRPKQPDNK